MKTDFNEMIDRKNTDSMKYDLIAARGKPADTLPLWVADMDFRAPDCVRKALRERVEHGIFGYTEGGADYFCAMRKWFAESTGWEIQPNWLVKTPGVVFAAAMAVRAFTEKGEGVLLQEPVYYPFADCIESNGRIRVVSELQLKDGRYTIDLEDFEKKIVKENVKLFILCNPHNPVGRVWTKEELISMGDICVKHGVLVLADEIHQDFIYPGHCHSVFSELKPAYTENSVICTAPSKTFNLAGLQLSNIFIPNRDLRRRFRSEVRITGYGEPGLMGLIACRAAYLDGREWFTELQEYLNGNLAFLRDFLRDRIPEIHLIEPEGTYLAWLDCRCLGLSENALEALIVENARLWLDPGTMFGAGGAGFERINLACPQKTLETALLRLENAVGTVR